MALYFNYEHLHLNCYACFFHFAAQFQWSWFILSTKISVSYSQFCWLSLLCYCAKINQRVLTPRFYQYYDSGVIWWLLTVDSFIQRLLLLIQPEIRLASNTKLAQNGPCRHYTTQYWLSHFQAYLTINHLKYNYRSLLRSAWPPILAKTSTWPCLHLCRVEFIRNLCWQYWE